MHMREISDCWVHALLQSPNPLHATAAESAEANDVLHMHCCWHQCTTCTAMRTSTIRAASVPRTSTGAYTEEQLNKRNDSPDFRV